MSEVQREALSAIAQRGDRPQLDPMAQSDLEDALTGWLEEHGVEEPWRLAPTLASAGLGPERLTAITTTARTTIYTPGSTAGVPLNLVGSLQAPTVAGEQSIHAETDKGNRGANLQGH